MYVLYSLKSSHDQVAQLLKEDPLALKTTHGPRVTIKPVLPSKDDVPLCGVTFEKDYVVANAVDNILSRARCPVDVGVNYLKKEDFGKIPRYIERIKKDIEKENTLAQRAREQAAAAESAKRRLLPQSERAAIVSELKCKWEKVNSEYQQMTHITVLDTLSKVHRKEKLEAELSQLEKDIALLERNEDIYVDLEH